MRAVKLLMSCAGRSMFCLICAQREVPEQSVSCAPESDKMQLYLYYQLIQFATCSSFIFNLSLYGWLSLYLNVCVGEQAPSVFYYMQASAHGGTPTGLEIFNNADWKLMSRARPRSNFARADPTNN
jgi:hypothetical protein